MLPDERMVEAFMRPRLRNGRCPACYPSGTVEDGPAGATYSVVCDHGGLRQQAEITLRRVFAALDRDALIERAALGIADEENWPHGKPNPTEREREFARRALVAIGLIPARESA